MSPSSPKGTHDAAPAAFVAAPEWLRARHAAKAKAAERAALAEAERTGKPAGVVLAQRTKRLREQMGEAGPIDPKTERAYRRAHALMLEAGQTPDEKARSRAHYDFLRSAWRWCERDAIDCLTRSSERARKRGDLDKAKARTRAAFERAQAFEAVCLNPARPKWTDQRARLKARGEKPARKSKRYGAPCPSADAVAVALVNEPAALARHEHRAAVVALFGCRPAEIVKGVRLTVETSRTKRGKPFRVLGARIDGAKVSSERGQERRLCALRVEGRAAAALADAVETCGGSLTLSSTDADVQSLNGFFARAFPGVSCYSFRHRCASDLKGSGMRAEDVAAWLGHRATKSQSAYGRRRWGGGGKGYAARASETVKSNARARPRAAKPVDGGFRFPSRPRPAAVPRAQYAPPVSARPRFRPR